MQLIKTLSTQTPPTLHAVATPTMVLVSREVLSINDKIMVRVKLPEFAIDDIKVFVREEVGYLINVWFLLEQRQHLEEVAPAKLAGRDAAVPVAINNVKDTTDYLQKQE